MSDDGENVGDRKRPNANYRLSKEKTNPKPDEIVYHYNRDRRLEKAPQSVQDLYYKEEQPRRGLFRGFSSGRIQLFTMIAILLVSTLALVTTILGRNDETHDLDGNLLTVQAIRYESMVIVAIGKTTRPARQFLRLRPIRPAYTGPVNIEVWPASHTEQMLPFGNLFFHMVNFTEESPEFFRFTVPFDADGLELAFRTESRDLYVMVAVE